MGKIIDLYTIIKDRLDTAKASGTLSYMQELHYGFKEHIYKDNNLPFMVLHMDNGADEPIHSRGIGFRHTFTVSVRNQLKENGGWYDAVDGSGILKDVENIINAVWSDWLFNSKAVERPTIDYSFEVEGEKNVVAHINFRPLTKVVSPGAM